MVADFRIWLDAQQDAALEIGIGATRFWNLTPALLAERVEMFRRRQDRLWERTAWLAHHVMAAFIGSDKTPSVDRLLGRETDA